MHASSWSRRVVLTAASALLALGLPLAAQASGDVPKVRLTTSAGDIVLELYPQHAPKTVENFVQYVKDGHYDGTVFHRVIENFMLQTGDPSGTGGGGESIYGAPFEDEFNDHLVNIRGALSMANAGPGTNGSQFFIVQAPEVTEDMFKKEYPQELRDAYLEQGGTPWLDGGHTVFGQVIEGLDVVDAIAAVETVSEKPVEEVTIESIEILQQ